MLSPELKSTLFSHLPCSQLLSTSSIHGGCINSAYKITTDTGAYFLKLNSSPSAADMFQSELTSLKILRATGCIKVPQPYFTTTLESSESLLVMEYMDLNPVNTGLEERFASDLAALHSLPPDAHYNSDMQFGFPCMTYCGLTSQPNTFCADWTTFFTKYRLEHQLALLQQKNQLDRETSDLFKKLAGEIPRLFHPIQHDPSALIHGDLWSGNVAAHNNHPVIFDPAAYYAHPEAELGMMRIMGGFGTKFWNKYFELRPKKEGFDQRIKVYELYHWLNHWNLFGGGYKGSAIRCLKSIIA